MSDHEHDEERDPDLEDEWGGVFIFSDAEGNETRFKFLAIVLVEGNRYALLTPADADEDEVAEIFIFCYEQDEDGGESFSEVSDEVTFAKVRARAEALFAQAEEEEPTEPDIPEA